MRRWPPRTTFGLLAWLIGVAVLAVLLLDGLTAIAGWPAPTVPELLAVELAAALAATWWRDRHRL